MQITIIPLGTESTSVGTYVADIQQLLNDRDVDFVLNDMGTVIHGNSGELLQLAAEIHEHPFSRGAQRVVTQIVLDDRRDKEQGIGTKRQSVLKILEERKK